MKLTKYILILLISMISNHAYSQMVVTNPSSDFADALRWAEEKVYMVNEKTHNAQLLLKIKQQLQEMQKVKEATEDYYKLAEKVQDDLKKLGAVANGGLPAFVHACEIVLGETLNPADYVPNVDSKLTKDFRKMVSYDSYSQISQDTREIQKELFEFSENPDKMQELSLTSHLAEIAGLSHNWRGYKRNLFALNADRTKYVSIELKNASSKLLEQLQEEGDLALTEAERMDMLIKAVNMYREAVVLEEIYADQVQEMLDEAGPTEADMVDYVEKGIEIKLDYTLKNVVQPYSKNSGFSLAKFDKKAGKVANLNKR